jgi:hypothetical protein
MTATVKPCVALKRPFGMCFVHGSVPFGSGKSGAAHRFKIVPEGDCKTTQNGARVASVDLNGALDKTVAAPAVRPLVKFPFARRGYAPRKDAEIRPRF